jgi:hypothetical protein
MDTLEGIMILSQFISTLLGKNVENLSEYRKDRNSPRYNITLYAPYQAGGSFIERRGNISIGGFCFEGEKSYTPGTTLDLLFRLPGTGEWIHARGQVLGQTETQGFLGIRGCFTRIDFEDERRLARWLDEMTLRLEQSAA